MNINKINLGSTVVLSVFLSACGGGGGGDPQPGQSDASAVQGVYEGTISNGYEHNTLVLEDGQFYTMYGNTIGSVFGVAGFVKGQGNASNGSFASTDAKDYFYDGSVSSGSLSASYRQNVSFNGSITPANGGGSFTFTGTPIRDSLYDYNTAANLANITGAWSLTSLQGETVTFNISSDGSFTGSSSGCTISGELQPRSSGKNVFDVTLEFGAAPCLLPNETASGIALEYDLADGSRQLIVAGTTDDRTKGTAFLGMR